MVLAIAWSPLISVIPDGVGFQNLMVSGQNNSYHVNPWSPEDDIVGRFDVKDAKFCDDIVWIHSDRECDCSG